MIITRRKVRTFVSWAHADRQWALALLDALAPRLKIAERLDFVVWRDSDLYMGAEWERKILQRAADCQAALLLVSPAFFASDFIVRRELPLLLRTTAPPVLLPVGLGDPGKPGRYADWHGLDARQLFLLDGSRWYRRLTSAQQRERFVAGLATKVIDAVDPEPDKW